MLMETEDETKRSPTARVKGFFSGLARETIARKDDAVLLGSSPEEGMSLDDIVRFGTGDVWATSCVCGDDPFCKGFGVDESHLGWTGATRGCVSGRLCKM